VQQRLDTLLAEQSFDLLVVDDNAGAIYCYPAAIPAILIEHEVRRPRPVDWGQRQASGWLRWALGEIDWQRWRSYQLTLWRNFDRIQVFSERDAAAIAALAPELAERVRVNPFGMVLPSLADPAREEEKTLLFVGGFSHQPNVDAARWLGEAIMPRLRARCPGVRLLIVGSEPPPEITALAGEDILVLGHVPAIEPVLARAAVILAPVRIGGGMRMKVLQGMALGKPVVTTTRGAEGFLLDSGQLPLVIADSAQEIADAVASLFACAAARRQLGQRARAFVAEQHSAAAYAGRLEAIYAELQRSHSDPSCACQELLVAAGKKVSPVNEPYRVGKRSQ
jgi:glycosyltransferase involved in cell wall biosynthesis